MSVNIFEVKEKFYYNGNPVQILSGGIHYFRIVPEYWRDRLEKLKAMGCNTVETYVPWNMHEPKKGSYNFSGLLDIKRFCEIAAELGLWVIIRPSPYICAEWEFGGLPAWLLAEDGMHLRGCYGPFLKHVREYYNELFRILTPLQVTYGGPIIMMQVENEYGYYGDDTSYLETLKSYMLESGVVVPLVTSDGPWGDSFACGSIKGVLPTGNFGSQMKKRFQYLKKYTEGGPLMCMEFWVGWFDHWGSDRHMVSNLQENCTDLEEAIRLGNINIYMFIGGTNFGFMNGSNYYDVLTPDVTSYDYDAVLSECGDITPKYRAFRDIIGKTVSLPPIELSTIIVKKAYGEIKIKEKVGLFEVLDNISESIYNTYPLSMEKLGQGYGYIVYKSTLKKEKNIEKLRLWGTNDRANIYVNNKPILTLYDRELLLEHTMACEFDKDSEISILVENMGRVNFGPLLEEQRKGINGHIQINGHQHLNWDHYCLQMDNLEKLDFSRGFTDGCPAFYRFEFMVDEVGDTFLDFDGWGKGCAFINGFNLGRFWEIGPQKRLYLPAPLLRKGKNEIVMFETEGKAKDYIELCEKPELGCTYC